MVNTASMGFSVEKIAREIAGDEAVCELFRVGDVSEYTTRLKLLEDVLEELHRMIERGEEDYLCVILLTHKTTRNEKAVRDLQAIIQELLEKNNTLEKWARNNRPEIYRKGDYTDFTRARYLWVKWMIHQTIIANKDLT